MSDGHDGSAAMTTYQQKITFGEMRTSGVRDVLIYCRDHRCSHHIEISAHQWPDDVGLSDIEGRFTCTACGKRGAEVRPSFPKARMGTGIDREAPAPYEAGLAWLEPGPPDDDSAPPPNQCRIIGGVPSAV